jgi:hypothetical protein
MQDMSKRDLYIKAKSSVPILASGIPQTGQIISYDIGDDGYERRGFLDDFLTLPTGTPNIWGRFERFTGVSGGYHDGTTFRDVNGSVIGTDEAAADLAFPDRIVVNWSTRNQQTNQVLGMSQIAIVGTSNWSAKLAACLAYSTTLYPTGWFAGNFNEHNEYLKHGDRSIFNYPPWNANNIGSANGVSGFFGVNALIWTFTTHSSDGSTMITLAPTTGTVAKIANLAVTTTNRNAHPMRYFTISGNTLL